VFIAGPVLPLKRAVMAVDLRTEVKNEKANGHAKYGIAASRKKIISFVINVMIFLVK